jgi:hypothetical protein
MSAAISADTDQPLRFADSRSRSAISVGTVVVRFVRAALAGFGLADSAGVFTMKLFATDVFTPNDFPEHPTLRGLVRIWKQRSIVPSTRPR